MGFEASWLKAQRLRRPAEFKQVFDHGVWGVSPSVRVVIARGPGPGARFGFAISKRFGNAVQRNTIRRRMKEILRVHAKTFSSGVDCVVLPSQKNSKPSFEDLAAALPELVRQTIRRMEKQERREAERASTHKAPSPPANSTTIPTGDGE